MRGVGQVLLTVFISYSEDPFSVYTLYSVHIYIHSILYNVHIGNLSKHGLLCRAKNNNNIICFRFYLQLFTQHGRQYIDERCKKVHSRLGRFLLLSESVRRKYGFYNATLVVYTLFWCFVRKQLFFNFCLFNVETW